MNATTENQRRGSVLWICKSGVIDLEIAEELSRARIEVETQTSAIAPEIVVADLRQATAGTINHDLKQAFEHLPRETIVGLLVCPTGLAQSAPWLNHPRIHRICGVDARSCAGQIKDLLRHRRVRAQSRMLQLCAENRSRDGFDKIAPQHSPLKILVAAPPSALVLRLSHALQHASCETHFAINAGQTLSAADEGRYHAVILAPASPSDPLFAVEATLRRRCPHPTSVVLVGEHANSEAATLSSADADQALFELVREKTTTSTLYAHHAGRLAEAARNSVGVPSPRIMDMIKAMMHDAHVARTPYALIGIRVSPAALENDPIFPSIAFGLSEKTTRASDVLMPIAHDFAVLSLAGAPLEDAQRVADRLSATANNRARSSKNADACAMKVSALSFSGREHAEELIAALYSSTSFAQAGAADVRHTPSSAIS